MLLGMINDILDLAKIESGKMEVRSRGLLAPRRLRGPGDPARRSPSGRTSTSNAGSTRRSPCCGKTRASSGRSSTTCSRTRSSSRREGGRVTLRARADRRVGSSVVEDTGIGIAEEDRETIFEKFRQATGPGQRTHHPRVRGTGLGLHREGAVKLLGGEVSLVSEFGKGSTFSVRLPMRLDERPQPTSDPLSSPHVGLNRLTNRLLDSPNPAASGTRAPRRQTLRARPSRPCNPPMRMRKRTVGWHWRLVPPCPSSTAKVLKTLADEPPVPPPS